MTTHHSRATLLQRRTKIVATLGPASSEPEVLDELIRAGVNVFRLSLSHGEYNDHRLAYHRVRVAAAAAGDPIAVLADLCGPKMRVGRFAGGKITLAPGQHITVTTQEVLGGPGVIPTEYAGLADDVRPGDHILCDDGMIELSVDAVAGTEVDCTVVHGGTLRDRKGMNLPGVAISSPSLTDQDRADARFALDLGVDYLALSFVRRPGDVEDLRALIKEVGPPTPVIAKIEKPEALDAIDEIIDASDGLMVARGDLGVELPPEAVPIVQQDLVTRARQKNKPVIIATQMLESMVERPRPTRAEVSDVSHAVFSGADAVMLSAETASGAHPVRAVEMMDRVARQSENWQRLEGAFRSLTEHEQAHAAPLPLRLAVARSTAQLSRDLQVRAVVVRTLEGLSAEVVSATRPAAPVVALTVDAGVCRRLNLFWGVIPRQIDAAEFEQPLGAARRIVQELGLAQPGQVILLLAGFGKQEPTITVLPV
jgi:pyruvate kinase